MVFPAFAAWAALYGKDTSNSLEREAIYNANVKYIEEHNEAYGNVLGLSPFLDMTQEAFKDWAYTVKPMDSLFDKYGYIGRHEYGSTLVPEAVDWSTKGAVTPIKNQGTCGSCWAFSTTGSLEGRLAISSGKLTSLSEQQFVDCDKAQDEGCNGGLMDSAFVYAKSAGVCTEDSYKYTGSGGSCKKADCKIGLPASAIKGYKDVAPDSMDALAEAVAAGPVSVAVDAETAFQFYFGGILKTNFCGDTLDHGVLVVGFGVDAGTQYWKVKNSWGASWGEHGYIRMLKNKGNKVGECGILKQPSYPVIEANSSVVV